LTGRTYFSLFTRRIIPDIAHKKLHDDFTADVVKFVQKYEREGATTEVIVSVVSGLGDWTRDHIRATDQELGKFLVSALQGK
jgi:hemerythrin